jgi:hypothetical protein
VGDSWEIPEIFKGDLKRETRGHNRKSKEIELEVKFS